MHYLPNILGLFLQSARQNENERVKSVIIPFIYIPT